MKVREFLEILGEIPGDYELFSSAKGIPGKVKFVIDIDDLNRSALLTILEVNKYEH